MLDMSTYSIPQEVTQQLLLTRPLEPFPQFQKSNHKQYFFTTSVSVGIWCVRLHSFEIQLETVLKACWNACIAEGSFLRLTKNLAIFFSTFQISLLFWVNFLSSPKRQHCFSPLQGIEDLVARRLLPLLFFTCTTSTGIQSFAWV